MPEQRLILKHRVLQLGGQAGSATMEVASALTLHQYLADLTRTTNMNSNNAESLQISCVGDKTNVPYYGAVRPTTRLYAISLSSALFDDRMMSTTGVMSASDQAA